MGCLVLSRNKGDVVGVCVCSLEEYCTGFSATCIHFIFLGGI
jgi:hypothetical protein